jgi:hypothetical protein
VEIQLSERSVTPNSDIETSSDNSLKRGDIISEVTGQMKYRKKTKKTEDKKVDEAELEIMKSISTRLERKGEVNANKEKDEDDMFCCLLATQLRQLNPRDKLMAKMQINNTVYNFLMKPIGNVPPFSQSLESSSFTGFRRPSPNVMQPDVYNTGSNASGNRQIFNIPSNDDIDETRQYFSFEGH